MARSATISWFDGSVEHIRVYTAREGHITEECWDGEGWSSGGYSTEGDSVAAAIVLRPDNQPTIMVFHSREGTAREWYWECGSWLEGGFEAEGTVESATAWVDASGDHHTRVYVRDGEQNLSEVCWDPEPGWHPGRSFSS